MRNLIPLPASAAPAEGFFELRPGARLSTPPGQTAARAVAEWFAARLRAASGLDLPLVEAGPAAGDLHFKLDPAAPFGSAPDRAGSDEGYTLEITPAALTLTAAGRAGLFYGTQTMLQLLDPAAEAGPWRLPAGRITDRPRFAWRGMMLDIARHFFGLEVLKRLVDWLAYHKLNRLHLHLTDDQGWRLEIKSWPKLTAAASATSVGGDPGGYLTQADFRELAAYAAERHVLLVPEIDMPGHTNAALTAYPELSADGQARPLYTGTEVGFSTLAADQDVTYRFLADVLGEIAALSPAPWLHLGGDETASTPPDEYQRFFARALPIVTSLGKQVIGWEEIGQTPLPAGAITQIWTGRQAQDCLAQDAQLILSPASLAYLDMKYTPRTALGLDWAGCVEVKDAYDWDPATAVAGVPEARVLGVEAALWTETIRTPDDLAYMAFPRLAGLAEIGWSPAAARNWDDYRRRLAAHGARLKALGINFYRSPQVDW